MREHDDLKDRLTLNAKDLERLSGIAAKTYLYWAWLDDSREPEDRVGPPSIKRGRRRLWVRESFLRWLDDAPKQQAGHDVPATPRH
jgi:hypothetical protein